MDSAFFNLDGGSFKVISNGFKLAPQAGSEELFSHCIKRNAVVRLCKSVAFIGV